MRTNHRDDHEEIHAQGWREVEDELMDEVMSMDEAVERVQTWLDLSILPQDSISMRHGAVEEELLQT